MKSLSDLVFETLREKRKRYGKEFVPNDAKQCTYGEFDEAWNHVLLLQSEGKLPTPNQDNLDAAILAFRKGPETI
jgi:hypothetical protein